MPSCQVCNHNNRVEIDRAICRGENISQLAKTYGVSRAAVDNHGKHHISYQLKTAVDRQMGRHGEQMMAEMDGLITRTQRILDRAESEGKLDTALKGIGQIRGTYELVSKVAVDLHNARIEEERLQLERDQLQLASSFWQQARDTLTEGELGLLQLLHEKANAKDPGRSVIQEATKAGYLPSVHIQLNEPGDWEEGAGDTLPFEDRRRNVLNQTKGLTKEERRELIREIRQQPTQEAQNPAPRPDADVPKGLPPGQAPDGDTGGDFSLGADGKKPARRVR